MWGKNKTLPALGSTPDCRGDQSRACQGPPALLVPGCWGATLGLQDARAKGPQQDLVHASSYRTQGFQLAVKKESSGCLA